MSVLGPWTDSRSAWRRCFVTVPLQSTTTNRGASTTEELPLLFWYPLNLFLWRMHGNDPSVAQIVVCNPWWERGRKREEEALGEGEKIWVRKRGWNGLREREENNREVLPFVGVREEGIGKGPGKGRMRESEGPMGYSLCGGLLYGASLFFFFFFLFFIRGWNPLCTLHNWGKNPFLPLF